MASDSQKNAINRPAVSWIHGLARFLLLIIGGTIVSLMISELFPRIHIHRLVLADICIIGLAISTARSNIVLAIKLYQRYAPEHIRMRCAMTPTCSEYALMAIGRYGLLRGIRMTYRRLRHRCNGSPVIDFP